MGLLAAFALVTYVGGVEDEASAGAQRVPVVRVARDSPRGLTGREAREQGYLEEAAIAAEFRPASAMVDLAAIDLNVAGTDLAAGQVLVDGMFVDPAAAQLTAARRVPEGEVAITVSVDQVRGVAGLISPGDKITVFILDPVLAGAWYTFPGRCGSGTWWAADRVGSGSPTARPRRRGTAPLLVGR